MHWGRPRQGAGARLRCINAVTPIRFADYHHAVSSFPLMSLYVVLNMGALRHSTIVCKLTRNYTRNSTYVLNKASKCDFHINEVSTRYSASMKVT